MRILGRRYEKLTGNGNLPGLRDPAWRRCLTERSPLTGHGWLAGHNLWLLPGLGLPGSGRGGLAFASSVEDFG